MNRNILYIGLFAIVIALSNSFFVVNQKQQALVFQFGEVVRVVKEPGLSMKIPFLQSVDYFDLRLLNFMAEEKEVVASDQKRLIVSAYAKYKIDDPLEFYKAVQNEAGARSRLNAILESAMRQIVGVHPLSALLSEQRIKIMDDIQTDFTNEAKRFGIKIVDVRILRADLPKANSQAINERLQTYYEKQAREFRAEGAEEAQKIRAEAEKNQKVIVAEAQNLAQINRGRGDAKAAKISADAYSKDPDFFDFYKSMQVYKNVLTKENTRIILSPNHKFFKYLNAD
ncbi:MAG: protease modulator HflC [Rickettsiales bacterium]|jgi:membrane protease subunit HflC|nr:protease modulator HflC [Rickettsiales bacterium]